MAFVFCYTRPGEGIYDNRSFPGHIGYKCDIDHAMHLAVSNDGVTYDAMRNNTAVLFPRATFAEGPGDPWPGVTKTLLDPWLCRAEDGTFLVSCVRRNQNAPDPLSVGSLMLFSSPDLVHYKEAGFLKLSDTEIRRPRLCWDDSKKMYLVQWETEEGLFCGETHYFKEIRNVSPMEKEILSVSGTGFGIYEAVPGNVLEITDNEAAVIRSYFDEIRQVGMVPAELTTDRGKELKAEDLPKVTMTYSDGSTHDKLVLWDEEALKNVDWSNPGTYEIPGTVFQRRWPFPIPLSPLPESMGFPARRRFGTISDPCITYYKGKYILTSSGPFIMRISDKLEEVHSAPVIRYGKGFGAAQELHIIHNVPYIFTSCHMGDMSKHEWWVVDGYILRCHGEIDDPDAWEEPRMVVKPNGKKLTENGLSIDISYFCDNNVHYAIWSDRKIHMVDGEFVERVSPEPADIYIATIDPDEPWQLTSEPQCIIRPMYGWDRCETEVDEGPYILRHGDDLFICISGSSTGMSDLYTLGFLRARTGTNLLNPSNWEWIAYPFLTKESFPNQFGPGHCNFFKDDVTGDDLMSFHAVPHDEDGLSLGRMPGIRRVHWAKTGLPYLEMSEERDLSPEYRHVTLKLTIR